MVTFFVKKKKKKTIKLKFPEIANFVNHIVSSRIQNLKIFSSPFSSSSSSMKEIREISLFGVPLT